MKNLFLFAALFSKFLLYSQIQKGTVTDGTGSPIENAYLFNSTSQTHAHTNELGNYSIDKTNNGDVLTVTVLGYKKKNSNSK